MELAERVGNLDRCAYHAYCQVFAQRYAPQRSGRNLTEEKKNQWRYIAAAVLVKAEEVRNQHEAKKRLRLFSVAPCGEFVLDYIDE